MNIEELNNAQKLIRLSSNCRLQDQIKNLVVLLYSPTASSQIHQFVSEETIMGKGVQIIKQNQIYWLFKCCSQFNSHQQEEIQRIVGVSETIVCVQLQNNLQAFIEKCFCHAESQFFETQTDHKLIFVKNIYKEKESSSNIKYFSSLESARKIFTKNNTSTNNILRLIDLIQMIESEDSKKIAKINALHLKYQEIRKNKLLIEKAQRVVFDQTQSKSQIKAQIESLKLDKTIEKQILWKVNQFQKYNTLLQDEDIKISQAIENNQITLACDETTIKKNIFNHQKKILDKLKTIYHETYSKQIQSDYKEFKTTYLQMRKGLQKKKSTAISVNSKQILEESIIELDRFYKYHIDLIEDGKYFIKLEHFLGIMRYIKGEGKYLWKYKKHAFKKFFAFSLFIVFAYFQQNYLGSILSVILAILILGIKQ